MLAAPKEMRGHQYVPSMAVGVLLVSPAVAALLTCVPRHTFHFKQARLSCGVLAGCHQHLCRGSATAVGQCRLGHCAWHSLLLAT